MSVYCARRVAPGRFEVPEVPAFPPVRVAHVAPSRRVAAAILRGERAHNVNAWLARRGFDRVA